MNSTIWTKDRVRVQLGMAFSLFTKAFCCYKKWSTFYRFFSCSSKGKFQGKHFRCLQWLKVLQEGVTNLGLNPSVFAIYLYDFSKLHILHIYVNPLSSLPPWGTQWCQSFNVQSSTFQVPPCESQYIFLVSVPLMTSAAFSVHSNNPIYHCQETSCKETSSLMLITHLV